MWARHLLPTIAGVSVACGPSVDDQVAELAADRADDDTRQALLLAKERAVTPLLAALESQPGPAARGDIARVLAALLMRTDDARIEAALVRLLEDDPDQAVRADVARLLGLQRRAGAVPHLLEALDDAEGQVRQEAMTALRALQAQWGEQAPEIHARARDLTQDVHLGARVEAMVVLSAVIQERLRAARQASLSGNLARAESLLVATLAFAPGDKRAAYDLGRLYLDNGNVVRGQQVLRSHGMLLDVPRLEAAPAIDGHVGEAVWQEAAHTGSFWQLSDEHEAALPTELRTDLYLGWRPEGLHVAMICWDEATEDLVVGVQGDDDFSVWREDRLELFIDSDMDRVEYAQVCINSVGTTQDASFRAGRTARNVGWDADGKWATAVEGDRWSVEVVLRFGVQHPRPKPGDMWSANFVRCYRGQEFVQWARTSGDAHRPDQFGVLLFR